MPVVQVDKDFVVLSFLMDHLAFLRKKTWSQAWLKEEFPVWACPEQQGPDTQTRVMRGPMSRALIAKGRIQTVLHELMSVGGMLECPQILKKMPAFHLTKTVALEEAYNSSWSISALQRNTCIVLDIRTEDEITQRVPGEPGTQGSFRRQAGAEDEMVFCLNVVWVRGGKLCPAEAVGHRSALLLSLGSSSSLRVHLFIIIGYLWLFLETAYLCSQFRTWSGPTSWIHFRVSSPLSGPSRDLAGHWRKWAEAAWTGPCPPHPQIPLSKWHHKLDPPPQKRRVAGGEPEVEMTT